MANKTALAPLASGAAKVALSMPSLPTRRSFTVTFSAVRTDCQTIAANMLVLPLLAPRWSLISAASLILSVFVFSGALLWLGHLWFPPAAALLVVALSYPLWSWRRLELAMRYLNSELDELTREQARLAIAHPVDLRDSMAFLSFPISQRISDIQA